MIKSKNTKNKTSKYKKFKVSPIIPIIAIVEVIILISIVTYAWFTNAQTQTSITDMIEVAPNSELEIDFSSPDDQFINISKYLSSNFSFEPATSIDGRNIFFSTTGTFDKDNEDNMIDTEKMTFREGTVNDINSKYICIDFNLTNRGTTNIPVYLSSKSYFIVKDSAGNKANSSALRFAFYENDDSIGNTNGNTTVYFEQNFGNSGYDDAYIYMWNNNETGTEREREWPGTKMTYVTTNSNGKKIYSYTFDNQLYDNIIFNDGTSSDHYKSHQTVNITKNDIVNNHIYKLTKEYQLIEDKSRALYTHSEYTDSQSVNTYPVISPGTSAGFNRPYDPVLQIDNSTGIATNISPAYAYSFDDYLYKTSGTSLFQMDPGQTKSLSLIIWLEGTDKDCNEENYSNLSIDMDFIFVTPDHNTEQLYTYKFVDKTLNTWVKDKTTSRTGNSVSPVVQLYDTNMGKGYLMSYDDSTSTWSCEAPSYICGHNIVFRRVNPGDESEVWNYWEAGNCANADGDYKIGTFLYNNSAYVAENTIMFTAFADSAPNNSTIYGSDTSPRFTNNPNRSCGGLWGDIQTHKMVVADLLNRVTETSKSTSSQENGAALMSLRYTYNGQDIEYKFDGPYNDNNGVGGFFYANVPNDILGKEVQFKKYINAVSTQKSFNSTSENPNLILTNDFNNIPDFASSTHKSTVQGWFYQINGSSTNKYSSGSSINESYYNNCYWGSDVLYVQNVASVENLVPGAWMQIKYHSTSGSGNKYTYLVANSQYKGDYNNGYVSVVPCDKTYNMYSLQICDNNNHSNIRYETSQYSSNGKYNTNINNTTEASGIIKNTLTNNIFKSISGTSNAKREYFLVLAANLGLSNNDYLCVVQKDGDGTKYTLERCSNEFTYNDTDHGKGNVSVYLYTCLIPKDWNKMYIQLRAKSNDNLMGYTYNAIDTNQSKTGDGYYIYDRPGNDLSVQWMGTLYNDFKSHLTNDYGTGSFNGIDFETYAAGLQKNGKWVNANCVDWLTSTSLN